MRLGICLSLLAAVNTTVSRAEEVVKAPLPEAPSTLMMAEPERADPPHTAHADVAKKYSRIVGAGQQGVPLTAKDKMALSLLDRASISSVAASAFSAGYGYWRNDTPHYGVNLPAYGERFGAAELKATSESFFSYGLYASVFHDDPRYYVMGRSHKVGKRAIYSASRIVITRKDNGDSAVNWSKLAGLTSAAALTNAYYPEQDRRVGRTATSVLSSIAVGAGVNELHEFLGDAMRLVFHKQRDAESH